MVLKHTFLDNIDKVTKIFNSSLMQSIFPSSLGQMLIAHNQHILSFDQRDSSETLHRNSRMCRLVHRRSLHLLQFAFKLKMKDDLLDPREIPTRHRVGIVFSLVKSNHYKFPKNPYYRCMLAWNSLPVDISLLDSKESFTKAVKDTVHNPYIKVL